MRKRLAISPWFIVGLGVWMSILLLRQFGIIIPVVNSYLTDFLTIPMYCYLIQYITNTIFEKDWKPSRKFIIESVIYLSVLFELVCPMISDRFTGDFFDVVSYAVGGFLYYILGKFYQTVS
ncbi:MULTISPECIES: hypothetical protein [unclassified Chryseobacterium]|uniref:hypothetical protein n=1 Tax=unclassified Chryseobacterium TaxID=2593645 RepID=UPI002269D03D|nr:MULTISPECIES: hypothetical protein [unclassified Chryseobacterium]